MAQKTGPPVTQKGRNYIEQILGPSIAGVDGGGCC